MARQSELPLLHSSEESMRMIVELIHHVEDINYQDGDGDTFLHAAIKAEDLDVANLILEVIKEKSGTVAILNNKGKTPYRLAKDMYSFSPDWEGVITELETLNNYDSDLIIETLYNYNYEWFLTYRDLSYIANIEYQMNQGGRQDLEILAFSSLKASLEECVNKIGEGETKTFIVNINNSHWVALVVTRGHLQTVIYYVDSLDSFQEVGDFLDELKKEIASVDVKTFYPKRSDDTPQQPDSYNCGLFALKNAELVIEGLRNGRAQQIGEILSGYMPDKDELCKERKKLANKLKEAAIGNKLTAYYKPEQLSIAPSQQPHVSHEQGTLDLSSSDQMEVDDTYSGDPENEALFDHFGDGLSNAVVVGDLGYVKSFFQEGKGKSAEITASKKIDLLDKAYANIVKSSKKVNVPGNGNCLFHAVALSYLIFQKHRSGEFSRGFKRLFGDYKDNLADFVELDRVIKKLEEDFATSKSDQIEESLLEKFRIKIIDEIKLRKDYFMNEIKVGDLFSTGEKDYFTSGSFQNNFRAELSGEFNEGSFDIQKLKLDPGDHDQRLRALTELSNLASNKKFIQFKFTQYLKIMESLHAWGGRIEIDSMSSLLESVINVWDGSHMRSFGLGREYDSEIYLFYKDSHYQFYMKGDVSDNEEIVKLLRDCKPVNEIVSDVEKKFTKAFVEVMEMTLLMYHKLGKDAMQGKKLHQELIKTERIVRANFGLLDAGTGGKGRRFLAGSTSGTTAVFFSLSDLVEEFSSCKLSLRKTLERNGSNIFRSFEAQVMEFGVDSVPFLVEVAVDRIIYYYTRKEYAKDREGTPIFEALTSDKYDGNEPAKMLNHKEKLYDIVDLYKNVGIVEKKGSLNFYYRKSKKDKATEYGYRRLFIGEKLRKTIYIQDIDKQTTNKEFTNYKYILNPEDFSKELGKLFDVIDKEIEVPDVKRISDFVAKVSFHIKEEAEGLRKESIHYQRERKKSLTSKISTPFKNKDVKKSTDQKKIAEENLEVIDLMISNLVKNPSMLYLSNLGSILQQRSNEILSPGGLSTSKISFKALSRVVGKFKKMGVSKGGRFSGREEEVLKIYRRLSSHGVVTLIDETDSERAAIARMYAQKHKESYQYVYEVSAEDMINIRNSFVDLTLEKLGIKMENKAMVIVHGAKYEDLNRILYIRDRGGFDALLISDDEKYKDQKKTRIVKLGNMGIQESILLAKKILSVEDESKDAEIEALVRELECSTLAIKFAAAYIRESKIEISEYLNKYRNLDEPDSGKQGQDRALSISLKISIEAIEEQLSKTGKLLIRVMAYLNPDQAYKPEFFAHEDTEDPHKIFELLEKYHIVEQGREWYEMSRLVSKEIRSKFHNVRKMEVLDFGIKVMGSSIDEYTEEVVLDSLTLLFQHAKVFPNIINENVEILCDVLYMLSFVLNYQKAADFGMEVLNTDYIAGSENELTILYLTSCAFRKLGNYQSAIELLEEESISYQSLSLSSACKSSIYLELGMYKKALENIQKFSVSHSIKNRQDYHATLENANTAARALLMEKQYAKASQILTIVSRIVDKGQDGLFELNTRFSCALLHLYVNVDGKKIEGEGWQGQHSTREGLFTVLCGMLKTVESHEYTNWIYDVVDLQSEAEQRNLRKKASEELESVLAYYRENFLHDNEYFSELEVRYYLALSHLTLKEDKEVLQEFKDLQKDVDQEGLQNSLAFKIIYRVSALLAGEEKSTYLTSETENRKEFLSRIKYDDLISYFDGMVLSGKLEFVYGEQKLETVRRSFQRLSGSVLESEIQSQCSGPKKKKTERSVDIPCVDSHYKEVTRGKGKEDVRYYYKFPKLFLHTFSGEITDLDTKKAHVKKTEDLGSEINNISEKNIEVLKLFAQVYKSLPYNSNVADSVLGESVYYFAGICRISLMKAVLPIIKDRDLKNILINNPEKLMGGVNFGLDYILRKIHEKILKKPVHQQQQQFFEELKNEIHQEVSSVLRERINQIATSNINESDLVSYVFHSVRLAEILLSMDSQEIDSGLQKVVVYNALTSFGALIRDHMDYIKINNPDHLDSLKDRILNGPLLDLAYTMHYLRNEIDISCSEFGDAMIVMRSYFDNEDIKDFVDETESYDEEVKTINFPQALVSSGGTTVYVRMIDSTGNSKASRIGDVASIQNINNYVLEGLEIKLKTSSNTEHVITEKVEGQGSKYYFNAGGYKIEVNGIIKDFTTDAEGEAINDKLRQMSGSLKLLQNKNFIEDIYDAETTNQDYTDVTGKIERILLKRGARQGTIDQIKNRLSELNKEGFVNWINYVKNDLEDQKIEFNHDKFDLAEIKGAKYGKLISFMAVYDLLDSMSDVQKFGRHDNDALKKIFITTGMLDAVDDVRGSLGISYIRSDGRVITKIPRDSAIGKWISKIPGQARKTFVKVINNPVVRGATFLSIAGQLAHSTNEITKGNHYLLNYYSITSSGIKLASMSINPISIVVSSARLSTVKSQSLRTLLTFGRGLSKASLATSVIDIVTAIGFELYERVEYTKAIGKEIPLGATDIMYLMLLSSKNTDNEYENIIRVKGYLDRIKRRAIRLLDTNTNVAGVVLYITFIVERYREIVKEGPTGDGHSESGASFGVGTIKRRTTCRLEEEVDSIYFQMVNMTFNANLSSLNISLPMKLCELGKEEVYILNKDEKHVPHLTKYEYEELGLRIVSAQSRYQVRKPQCGDVENKEHSDTVCSVGKVHRACQRSFIFSDEPFVLSNSTRLGVVVYLSGPRELTAAASYQAEMHVPEGNVNYTGSKNNKTTFVVNHSTSGTLQGAVEKENILVMNVRDKDIVANLEEGFICDTSISNCDSASNDHGSIKLLNVYNYESSSDSKHNVTTHCQTKLVNAKNAIVRQGNRICQDQDDECKVVVNEGSVYHRGLRRTVFIVSESSNNAKVRDMRTSERIKENDDVIYVNATDVRQLKISEEEKGGYSLNLLANNTQSIVSSVKVDSFENLVIQVEDPKMKGFVLIKNKSVFDIMKDAHNQMYGSLTNVDELVMQNNEKNLKAAIYVSIRDPGLPVDKTAVDIYNKNNLDIPICQVEVTNNLGQKATIGSIYSPIDAGNGKDIQHIRHKRHKQHHREYLRDKEHGNRLTDTHYRHSIAKEAENSLQNDEVVYNKVGADTSGASKPSSWINVFANSIVDAVKSIPQFIFSSFKPAIDMQPSKAMTTQGVDVNGTLLLLDVFIRKITGQKYISTADQPTISLQEAECHASDIINGFEKVLKETAVKSGISVTNLNFDPIKPQSAIVRQLRNGKFSEISKILYSSATQACPECKQTKRFLGRLETCIEGFLDKKELSCIGQKLRIEEAKQIRKQELCSSANFITDNPKTYLNEPTIDKQLQGSCHTISS